MKKLSLVLLALCSGCAWHSGARLSTIVTTSYPTGITTTEERVTETGPMFTIFDGKNTLDKSRVSNATKTQSIGLSGVEQEASGTNMVEALKTVRAIVENLSPK